MGLKMASFRELHIVLEFYQVFILYFPLFSRTPFGVLIVRLLHCSHLFLCIFLIKLKLSNFAEDKIRNIK